MHMHYKYKMRDEFIEVESVESTSSSECRMSQPFIQIIPYAQVICCSVLLHGNLWLCLMYFCLDVKYLIICPIAIAYSMHIGI